MKLVFFIYKLDTTNVVGYLFAYACHILLQTVMQLIDILICNMFGNYYLVAIA